MTRVRINVSFMTGVVMAMAASASMAQAIQAKPGLWAFATKSTINGNQAPSTLDLEGALSPPEKQQIRQAMRKLGLPDGWDPRLTCTTKSTYDVRAIIKKNEGATPGCTFNVVEQSANGAKFKGSCQGANASASAHGDVSVANGSEVKSSFKASGKFQGHDYQVDTQEVGKWVGPDCKHPPAGLSPEWVTPEDGN